MIDGIPYWGKNTYCKMRELENRVPKNVFYTGGLYELFLSLAAEGCVFQIKDGVNLFYSYVSDICFNYRDSAIIIPYYCYKKYYLTILNSKSELSLDIDNDTVIIRYAYAKRYKIIEGLKHREESIVVYKPATDELIKVNIIKAKTIEQNFSINTLYFLYKHSLYLNLGEDVKGVEYLDIKYHMIGKSVLWNTEYRLQKQLGLLTYGETLNKYTALDYQDMRRYNSDSLLALIPEKERISKPYALRKIEFEGYLYSVFKAELVPEEVEYQESIKQLGESSRILKIGDAKLPLILKYYYKPYIKYIKKVYEKYEKLD